jgi:hypothetical protein
LAGPPFYDFHRGAAMKIIAYTLLFAVIGLIAGYLLYGIVDGVFLDPRHILSSPPASDADAAPLPFDLEKIRTRVYAAGLIGAVSGLLFGFLTSGKKKKQAFS